MINPLDLHAFADNELSPDESAAIREQIQQDPQASAQLNSILNLKDCVRESVRAYDCEESWRACVVRLNDIDRTRRVEGFVGRYAWAICGLFFAMIVFGGISNRGTTGGSASLEPGDLIHIMHNVSPQRAPQLSAVDQQVDAVLRDAQRSLSGMQFSKPAIETLDGHKVARLLLRDRRGTMALLVIMGNVRFQDMQPLPNADQFQGGRMGSENCIAWNNGSNSLVLIGDRNDQDLVEVASHLSVR